MIEPLLCHLAEVPDDDPAWQRFVAQAPGTTVFHLPAWARAVADPYGFRPTVLAVRDGSGCVAAGLPVVRVRRLSGPALVSLPFTDRCAPLARDGASLAALAAELAHLSERRGLPVEVRGALPATAGWAPAEVGVEHVLELASGPEALRGRFSATHRRRLRQAERGGLRVHVGRSADAMEAFYGLHLRTRRRQGVPVQPRRFFAALWRHLLEPGLGQVLLAHSADGRAVAGMVLLAWNGIAMMKFQASDAEAWELRPNHLCYWAAIRWACEAGHRRLELGRTEMRHEGLRQWKGGWGAEAVPLTYALTGAGAPGLGGHEMRDAVLGHVIRHSPALVCRALGALFYRYAA